MAKKKRKTNKHPCPDCFYCQWCNDRKCNMCKGWFVCESRAEKGKTTIKKLVKKKTIRKKRPLPKKKK